jgi:DNA-binding GntR family transcriptional regulator
MPSGRVDSVKEAVATDIEARRLELRAGAKVIRIRRLRSNVPVIIERISVPANRFPDLASLTHEELTGLLYGLSRHVRGRDIKRTHRTSAATTIPRTD